MMTSFYNLLKYAATGQASPDMTYYDKMRASTLMGGGVVQTLTGIPPLSFKSDGTPLISWSMKGNGSQQGTPTPDNPVMPEFVGVKTANLAWTGWAQDFVSRIDNSERASIVTDDGRECLWYHVAAGYGQYDTKYIFKIEWKENTRYAISFYGKRPADMTATTVARLYYTDDTYENINAYSVGNFVRYAVVSAAGKTVKSLCAQYSSGNFLIDINTFMVNEGSTALPYEPFGWAEKITCTGQTVPVYLGTVPTVRRVSKKVFDGTEAWTKAGSSTSTFYYTSVSTPLQNSSAVCSHFETALFSSSNFIRIYDKGVYQDAAEFKAFLAAQYAAGTPVTVWYVLATPETGIVNEPLCKIGDYADELSSEDASVTIPTIKGDNTLTVDTTLQPSEMTITFKG